MVIAIFVNMAYDQYTGGYNFPIRTIQKELCFRAMGHFSPLFLAVSDHSPITSISTLNFGPFSRNLGGTDRAIKKMTHNDNGPGWNYGETAVFTFGQKLFNTFYPQKKHLKFINRLKFFFGKGNFFPVVARTWLKLRRECFFRAKNLGSRPKNPIFAIRPQFWSTDRL